jgi:MFS transporter, DHA3 family, macrolide efflux protein
MEFIAISWLAMELTGRGYAVALVLIFGTIPGILFAPLVGVLVDRFNRQRLAVWMDVFRAVVIIAVPVLWWLGVLEPWHLYAMTFLTALGDVVFWPTRMSLVREIVPERLLLTANATTLASIQTGIVLGAASSGLFIALVPPIWALVFDALSYLLSAVSLLFMVYRPVQHLVEARASFLTDLRSGFAYIARHRELFFPYFIMLVMQTTPRAINTLLPPFSKDVLKVGAAGFGLIDASWAIGAVLGGLAIPVLVKRLRKTNLMIWGLFALSFAIITFAASQNLIWGMLSYLAMGFVMQTRVLYQTSAQEKTELEYQGRVHSSFSTLFSIASLGIYMLMGYLGEIVSLGWLYVLQAAIIALAAVTALCVLFRELKFGSQTLGESFKS